MHKKINIINHYKLLNLILEKLGNRKKEYLSRKLGYDSKAVFRWLRKKDELVLTTRALQQINLLVLELEINIEKEALF